VAWGAGILAWRHLIVAELAAHRDAQLALRREAAERHADAARVQG
jgi:hypothetical protein